jgi:membrane protease YdiL (CAAX protease family)
VFEWIEKPGLKWAVPIPVLLLVAPLVWLFFRRTWRELESEALVYRQALAARGEMDYRPAVACLLGTFVLLVQEFFGKLNYFQANVYPSLQAAVAGHPGLAAVVSGYQELLGRSWWAGFRIVGYLLPLALWRLLFPRDRLVDMGLRTRGFREHAWIYALFVVVIIPLVWLAARQPDFGRHYPINGSAGRSWVDFLIWEALYVAQFLALEIFFRGWWIRACRAMGIGAIFCMVVPYAMVHLSKPYFEACGALVAGTVLGSLSMRTGSVWAGFLVHATAAVLMDVCALARQGQLPELLSAFSQRRFVFGGWDVLIWSAWGLALVVLGWRFLRRARR